MVGTGVRVRLLGPVEVVVAGSPQAVNGVRRKAVLADVGAARGPCRQHRPAHRRGLGRPATGHRGEHVAAPRLLPTRGARRARLSIVARQPGYLLDTGPDSTDVQAAERLIELARRVDGPQRAGEAPDGRVALWRGPPLADVAGSAWLEEQAEHLARLRLEAERSLAEARLSVGEHAGLVPGLERLVRRASLRRAPARAADARPVPRRPPGRGARHVPAAARQPAREPRPRPGSAAARPGVRHPAPGHALDLAAPATAAPTRVAPAQLPPAVPTFTGRDAELAALDALGRPAAAPSSPCPAPPASARPPSPCTGRTASADRFPDGQLYVNLRGFDPAATPTDPARRAARLPGRARRAGRPDPAPTRTRMASSVPQTAGRQATAGGAGQRPRRRTGPAAAARLTGLPRHRHQPRPAHSAGRRRGRPTARPRPAEPRRGPRPAGPPARASARSPPNPPRPTTIADRCARLPLALAIVAASAADQPGTSRWPPPPREPPATWTPSAPATRPPTSGRSSPGRTGRSARPRARLFRLLEPASRPGRLRPGRGQPGRRRPAGDRPAARPS